MNFGTRLHSTRRTVSLPSNFLVYSRFAGERLRVHLFPLSPFPGPPIAESDTDSGEWKLSDDDRDRAIWKNSFFDILINYASDIYHYL